MKKTAYIIAFALQVLCGVSGLQAQELSQEPILLHNNRIKVTPNELRQRGGDLYVKLKVETTRSAVGSRETVRLTPMLISPDGRTLRLTPMQINGGNEQAAYNRSLILSGSNDDYTDNTQIVRSGERINYAQRIRFRAWMADARLDIVAEVSGCGSDWFDDGSDGLFDSLALQRKIAPYMPDLLYSYLLPAKQDEDDLSLSTAYIEFPVNRSEIYRDFRNNKAELESVNYTLARLSSFTDIAAITGVDIRGYASPEGYAEHNEYLSRSRAEALRDYMVARTSKIPARAYQVLGGGEDWEGLRKLLEKSPEGNNTAIFKIFETHDPDLRKEQLIAFDGGEPYRSIYRDIYPKLRRVTYKINYTLKNEDATERLDRIEAEATDMSLDDMYQLTLRYPRGSAGFCDVLESAAKVYVNDPVANLNAASAALTRGDLTAAERYLNHVGDNIPEYGNVAGCLELLRGNYAVAEKLLNKAAKQGVEEAKHNLEELHKKRENIAAIRAEQKR